MIWGDFRDYRDGEIIRVIRSHPRNPGSMMHHHTPRLHIPALRNSQKIYSRRYIRHIENNSPSSDKRRGSIADDAGGGVVTEHGSPQRIIHLIGNRVVVA